MALQESGVAQFCRLRLGGKSTEEAVEELASLSREAPEKGRQRILATLNEMASSGKLDEHWAERLALLADQLHHMDTTESTAHQDDLTQSAREEDFSEVVQGQPTVAMPKPSIEP